MSEKSENFPGTTPAKGTIRIAQVLSTGRGANSGLDLHPQGHRLVTGWCGQSGGLDFWSVDTGQHLQHIQLDVELADIGSQIRPDLMPPGSDANPDNWPAHLLPVVDSSMNSLGGHVAVGAGRGVRIYRFSGDESHLVPSQTLRGHEQAVSRVAIDSSGEQAISADHTGQILVWNTVTGQQNHQLRISTVPHTLSFIWNNMLAMVGDDSGRIICWELTGGRRHLQFQAHHGAVERSAFNQDSGVLVTVGGDSSARMWNLEEGKQIGGDMRHRSAVSDVCFAYAGRFVVTCGLDGHIAIWNSTDGDLLDWYFDSSPVYRISFDKLNGTLIAGSARSVKVLSVDWQRLRELDADARSSFVMELSAADHAAMFSQPPTRPRTNYQAAASEEAPIGSIMSARQTTDLPIADRSNLSVPRAGAPAQRPGVMSGTMPAMPLSGRPNSVAPSNLGSHNPMLGMAPAPGPSASSSNGAPGHQNRSPFTSPPVMSPPPSAAEGANPFGRHPTPTRADISSASHSQPPGSIPSLAAAMASAQQRQLEADKRSTSYGIGKATANNLPFEANSFFNPVSPETPPPDGGASASGRVSRLESDLIESDLIPPPAGEPLAAASVPSAAEAVSESSVGGHQGSLSQAAGASLARSQAFNKRLALAIVTVLVFMVFTRSGVFWWYTEKAMPGSVAAEVTTVDAVRDAATAEANALFAEQEEAAQERIETYRRPNSGRTAEETETLIGRIEDRLDEKRDERDAEVLAVTEAHASTMRELEHTRRVSAARMANLSGLAAAVVGMLGAILLVGRARPKS